MFTAQRRQLTDDNIFVVQEFIEQDHQLAVEEISSAEVGISYGGDQS